ncbi:hypothetical protein QBC41DRAFT_302420 [Cercophora samala]|uniref:Transmembrane protein n=1 Tax=Cercophora samala TaxID=330535 RepID=A0AA39ZEM8_9PEZI|nr:hypothetical protein QBC41DRAFT_302420 [Cercophora samala]
MTTTSSVTTALQSVMMGALLNIRNPDPKVNDDSNRSGSNRGNRVDCARLSDEEKEQHPECKAADALVAAVDRGGPDRLLAIYIICAWLGIWAIAWGWEKWAARRQESKEEEEEEWEGEKKEEREVERPTNWTITWKAFLWSTVVGAAVWFLVKYWKKKSKAKHERLDNQVINDVEGQYEMTERSPKKKT